MQSTNLPSKFLVPFATNDSARVEVPVTTSAVGRASQSLGFPPITGQPPEAGGQPPQLEDFNGALNQASRVAWWSMLGGLWVYDATFAADTNINGYPNGAVLASADRTSAWLSLADNNAANPDTAGTNWAPAWAYGASALTGLTGGTQTLTPAQAMKHRVTLGGALASNLVVVVPAWVYNWTFVNNTTGAFTVTVKTASGSGAVVPQNGAPTPLLGDGANVSAPANNVPAATTSTQAMQFGQASGRLLRRTVYFINAGVQNISVNGAAPTPTGAGSFTALALTTAVRLRMCGGGGGGGGSSPTGANVVSAGGGGGGGAYVDAYITAGFSSPVTIVAGAGGAGGVNNVAGAAGTASSFGSLITCGGGAGGLSQNQIAPPFTVASGSGGAVTGTAPFVLGGSGQPGGLGQGIANSVVTGGFGAPSGFGFGGGYPPLSAANGANGGSGAGGSGAATTASQGAFTGTGGAGGTGLVIIEEYA